MLQEISQRIASKALSMLPALFGGAGAELFSPIICRLASQAGAFVSEIWEDEKTELVPAARIMINQNSELKRENTDLRRLALTDRLTELPNRRHIDQRLEATREEAERNVINGYAVAFVDVDKFKNFNDTYGHAVGDLALQHIANILKIDIRDMDFFGRYGGEEFILIIPGCENVEEAAVIVERHRVVLAGSPFSFRDKHGEWKTLSLTASFGVALACKGESVADVVHRADIAVYKAKGKTLDGQIDAAEIDARNRVCYMTHNDSLHAVDRSPVARGASGARRASNDFVCV